MSHTNYSPIEVAIALSLYSYNVGVAERVLKLTAWLDERYLPRMSTAELENALMNRDGAYAATELPYPTAKLYVQQALERYGREATQRVLAEEQGVV